MAFRDNEFPSREDYPRVTEEFSAPAPETEFRPPEPQREFSPPAGAENTPPDKLSEYPVPGYGADTPAAQPRRRHFRLLFFYGAAVILALVLLQPRPAAAPQPSPAVTAAPAPVIASLAPAASDQPILQPTPEPEIVPVSKVPEIQAVFYQFSHEHHGMLHLSNTGSLHTLELTVRETVLDKPVYEHTLSQDEINAGVFELPMLSTGDLYMADMDSYNALNSWPGLELTVNARYENEAGDGEDSLTLTLEPEFELGIGISYMDADDTWSDAVPTDSFYLTPWEDIDEIRYVINDPDAVVDPLVFSVDISYNGRHADSEEFETVIDHDDYMITDPDTGEHVPYTSSTRLLILRRPDWMPESGTVHVTITQRLVSTGELWIRDFDFDYPVQYDW